jgi:hypothetical protein
MDCLTDPFLVGRLKLKNAKEQRANEIALEKRKVELIWLAVKYFRDKRDKEGIELNATIDKLTSNNEVAEYMRNGREK